jgi:hypothetical protein
MNTFPDWKKYLRLLVSNLNKKCRNNKEYSKESDEMINKTDQGIVH